MEEQPPERTVSSGARIDTGELASLDDAAFVVELRRSHAAGEFSVTHLVEWQRRPAELLDDEPELAAAMRDQLDATVTAMRGAIPTTDLFEKLRSITESWEQPFAEMKDWAERFNSVTPIPASMWDGVSGLDDLGGATRPYDAIKLLADPHLDASHTLIDIVDQQRAESADALGVITEILARQEAEGATAMRINKWILGLTVVAAAAAVGALVVAIVALQ